MSLSPRMPTTIPTIPTMLAPGVSGAMAGYPEMLTTIPTIPRIQAPEPDSGISGDCGNSGNHPDTENGTLLETAGLMPGKLRHDPILSLDIRQIRPSSLNDSLYKPIDPSDPEILALAQSIACNGLKEPIVITQDRFILSGHRRFVACQLAGLETIRCRIEPIDSTDADFPLLLREYNRQRVKSIDEILREEIISADPAEAHRLLVEHRQQRARVNSATITIQGTKRRPTITSAKFPLLDAIRQVLRDRQDFWPLSDRQIHYALLNDPPLIHARKPASRYANDLKSYKALCELLTRARLTGAIPFDAIHDPTRPVTIWNVYRQPGPFIHNQLDGFLKHYYRDLMQSQPNHIEVVGEKNTIENIIRPVLLEYCVPFTIGRGYCSLPPRHEMAKRYRTSGKEKLVVLILSDFDPEGEDIGHSFARSMRDDFGIDSITPIKVALTRRQVNDMQLPPGLKAKAKSSRRNRFVERFGDDVFELEAVPPAQLQTILRVAIDSVLDVEQFNAEVDAEKRDAANLDEMRQRMRRVLLPMLGG